MCYRIGVNTKKLLLLSHCLGFCYRMWYEYGLVLSYY